MNAVATSQPAPEPAPATTTVRNSMSIVYFVIVMLLLGAITYACGWLYQWLYYGAFGLHSIVTLEPLSPGYFFTGLTVVKLASKLWGAAFALLLYLLIAIGAVVLIPITFIRFWDELSDRLEFPRPAVGAGLAGVYLAVLWLLIPRLTIPWQWGRARIGLAQAVHTFRKLIDAGLPASQGSLVILALAGLMLAWGVLRLFVNRLWPWSRTFVAGGHPEVNQILDRIENSRLLSTAPLSRRGRVSTLLGLFVLLFGLPAFFVQTGRLDAQAAMCDGGSLSRVQLYAKDVDLTAIPTTALTDQSCTFVIYEQGQKLYVFRPLETQIQDGQPIPVVHEIDRTTVQIRPLEKNPACLTCADAQGVASLPPLISTGASPGVGPGLASPGPAEGQFEPLIAVDTRNLPLITVVGAGWPAFATVTLNIVPENGAPSTSDATPLGQAISDNTGAFTATFLWDGTSPAEDVIVLARAEGTDYRAESRIDLTLPTVTPTPTLVFASIPTFTPIPLPTLIPVPTFPSRTPFPTFEPFQPFVPAGPAAGATGEDSYEPDDTAENSSYMSLGETQSHTFYPSGDVDVVRFRAKKGLNYRIYTHNLASGVDTKIILSVRGGQCEPADCQSDDAELSEILASEVRYRPEENGIVYITVLNLDQFGPDKRYQLTIAGLRPTATPTPSRTPTPSVTPTPSKTPTPSNTPLPTGTWTPTQQPQATAVPEATATLTQLIGPGNLTCQTIDASQIELQWADYSVDETDFRIEQSVDQQNWAEVATVEANSGSYTAGGLAPQSRYWFRVRAHRDGDNIFSEYTNMVGCITLSADG